MHDRGKRCARKWAYLREDSAGFSSGHDFRAMGTIDIIKARMWEKYRLDEGSLRHCLHVASQRGAPDRTAGRLATRTLAFPREGIL